LKPLLAEVDSYFGSVFKNHNHLWGIRGTLFAVAHILRSTHLSPELTRKGEDLLVTLRQFPGHGFQNAQGFRTEIYQLIDLLKQA
jgi:hypothetical protein